MCRILFKPNNQFKFDRKELEESYRTNPDGTGLIYYDPVLDKTYVQKWLAETPFEEIYKAISKAESITQAKCIGVHFRIGTSGGRGLEQIHPQHIDGDKYLFHNGICREFEVDNQKASDTQWIAYWLKEKQFELSELDNPVNKTIYENIFNGNKLLIIEKDKYKVINEDLGRWDKGVWKSWQANSLYGWDHDIDLENSEQLSLYNNNKLKEEITGLKYKDQSDNPRFADQFEDDEENIQITKAKKQINLLDDFSMAMDWNRDAIDQLDGEWSEDIASLPDYDFAPEEIREIQHKLEDSQAKIDDIRENLNQVDSMIYNLQQEKQEFVDNYEKQEKEQSFSRSR